MIADAIEQTIKTELPPTGVNVMVQCAGFRCLAFRTYDGKWLSTFSEEELNDVIRVLAWNEEPDSCAIPVSAKAGKPRRSRGSLRFQDQGDSSDEAEEIRTVPRLI